MLCFFDAGVVVLAVPKTGTLSLENALGPHADLCLNLRQPVRDKHMTYREFMATLEPEIRPNCKRPIEVFAVMREPLDWLGSWYRFRQRDSILNIRNSTRGISFEDFVRTYCSPEPPTWADLPPQIDFIEDEASGIGPDHLFRYEDHESFVKALGARLGIEIRLPRLNVAPEGNLELSAPTLARLRDHCARDFALYQQLSARRGPIQT